ncbi:MAG: restriction endonuclease subunit S [Syntrophales bacterium]|jgi:type I restriction enzyme S subunit|nr:restriction endonuclease subunit S [Syntrophales bacterium]
MRVSEEKLLEDVCEFIVDCLHATAPVQEDGFPLIRTPNIGRGRLLLDGVYRVSEDTYAEWTRRAKPETDDLILAREAPAGNVAIVKNGQTVCLGQRTVHLRVDTQQVDPDFLCYFLLAPPQQGLLLAGETGATAKHVNMKDIRRLPLRKMPSIEYQRRAGKFLAAYDDLIENNRRRIQLLEEAARLLYKEWFVHLRFPGHEHTKIIDGVPEGWEKKSLGAIAPLKYGKSLKKDDRIPGSFPVYGSSGIIGTHAKALVPGPTIIVGRKGNVGSVYWSSDDCHPIDTVYYIDSGHCTFFLYYALQQTTFISTDAAVPGLNRDVAHGRSLLVAEQKILRLFEDTVSPVHQQMELLKRQNASLTKARDLLLPKLMNGEVEV